MLDISLKIVSQPFNSETLIGENSSSFFPKTLKYVESIEHMVDFSLLSQSAEILLYVNDLF